MHKETAGPGYITATLDPCVSFQKLNVELNHGFIRKILPKGSSFDDLTQDDIS